MLDTLSPTARLAIVGGVAWYLLKPKDSESPWGPEGVPGAGGGPAPGQPGYGGGGNASQYGMDGGAAPRRYEEGIAGAETWDPDRDTIVVARPPWWGVRGCCEAWATATPSVRGARAGNGPMYSPRHGKSKSCGCKVPGQGGRPWFQPIEAVARRGNAPDTEVTPAAAALWHMQGEGAGTEVELRGFVHHGVAWVVSTMSRNWQTIADANPDVLYLVSTEGRCAYHKPTGRVLAPGAWRPRYKGRECPINANPWAVEPWQGWMMGRGKRGQTPLEADRSDGQLRNDFVGPPYLAAFMAKPAVVLPFAVRSAATSIKKPAKSARGPGKKAV